MKYVISILIVCFVVLSLVAFWLLWSVNRETQTKDADRDNSTQQTARQDSDIQVSTPETPSISLERLAGPIALHSVDAGRGLFASVFIHDEEVIVPYQIAPFDTLSDDKSLYYQVFDRDLNTVQAQTIAIDVNAQGTIWDGDMGDHKFTLLDDTLYMVATIKGSVTCALLAFDTRFNPKTSLKEVEHGVGDDTTDQMLDMGFANDGENLYVQFFDSPKGSGPSGWGDQLYKIDQDLNVLSQRVVKPESGTFVTGTSLVFVPKGEMGVKSDRLQIFSTNLDYANKERVGIHTFAVEPEKLGLLQNTTQTIIERDLDVYFPTGSAWNEKHQLWIVGYTQETSEGVHGSQDPDQLQELGPSFFTVFNKDWNEIETIQVNDNNPAFRVMLQTEGDDIYVVYDEMDKDAFVKTSQAKIEHYQIVEE